MVIVCELGDTISKAHVLRVRAEAAKTQIPTVGRRRTVCKIKGSQAVPSAKKTKSNESPETRHQPILLQRKVKPLEITDTPRASTTLW